VRVLEGGRFRRRWRIFFQKQFWKGKFTPGKRSIYEWIKTEKHCGQLFEDKDRREGGKWLKI